MGASPDEIAADYALTRIGVEPERERLLDSILAQTGFKLDQPGVVELCSTSPGSIVRFITAVNSRWGSVVGLAEKELNLTTQEIASIREKLSVRKDLLDISST